MLTILTADDMSKELQTGLDIDNLATEYKCYFFSSRLLFWFQTTCMVLSESQNTTSIFVLQPLH